jgi:hypothetical protein
MKKQALLQALQSEIHRHTFDYLSKLRLLWPKVARGRGSRMSNLPKTGKYDGALLVSNSSWYKIAP